MSGGMGTAPPPAPPATPPLPMKALQGVDPASGVAYVDFTRLEPKLCEPFRGMFVQGDRLGAAHYFEEVQEVNGTMWASVAPKKDRILLVGTIAIYLCELNSAVKRFIPIEHIRKIISTRDGMVGLSVEQGQEPDLLIKPPSAEYLVDIITRLHLAITGSPLPALHDANAKAELRFESQSTVHPPRFIPLHTVDANDPEKRSRSQYPSELHIAPLPERDEPLSDTQRVVAGRYAMLGASTDGMPKWCRDTPGGLGTPPATELCAVNGVWAVCTQPATVSSMLLRSAQKHAGRSPSEMSGHGGWEEYTEAKGWVISPLVVTADAPELLSGFTAAPTESASPPHTTPPPLGSADAGLRAVSPAPMSPATPVASTSPPGGLAVGMASCDTIPIPADGAASAEVDMWGPATTTSPVCVSQSRDGWGLPDATVSPAAEPLPEERECADLAGGAQRAALRIECLREQLSSHDARIGRLRRIEGEMRGDRDAICHLFALDASELRAIESREQRPPPLAPLVERATVPQLREADRAEAKLVAERKRLKDARQRLEDVLRQKQHMLTQLEAAQTFQSDSKEQLHTVMRCMGDLVERAQRSAKHRDEKQAELAGLTESHKSELDALRAERERDVQCARDALQQARDEREGRSEERVRQRLGAAKARFAALQGEVAEARRAQKERKEAELARSQGDSENIKGINHACSQLSVAHVRLDELEEEVSTSCALRYQLEQKMREVEEKDATVRRAIISLQSLRKAYDQHAAQSLQGLEKKREQVRNLQQSSAAAIQHTDETLSSLKGQLHRQQQAHHDGVHRLQQETADLKRQAAVQEDKKRWSYEQHLLLARCGSPPSRKREQSAELAIELSREMQETDARMQDVDKELIQLQAQVIEADEKQSTMKLKRDHTHAGLAQQQQAVLQSDADEETKAAEVARIREYIHIMQVNMDEFTHTLQKKRSAIREQENKLLFEKEQLLSQMSQLRERELAMDD